MLHHVAVLAVACEHPFLGLVGEEYPARSHGPDQATDHWARQRNVERAIRPAFRARNVENAGLPIDVLHARLQQRARATARQQGEEVKFASNGVAH